MCTPSSNPWVVIHHFEDKNSALLWSPSTQQSKSLEANKISKENLVLAVGDWLNINEENSKISKTDSTCNQRVIAGFLQIRAPVVFFSSKLSKDVGFSPGFGRVGSFAKDMAFEKDLIYMAWITYKKYSTNKDLQYQMVKYNVEWVVESQPALPIIQSELDTYLQANSLEGMPSITGVVVEKNDKIGSIYSPMHGVYEYQVGQKTALDVGSFVQFKLIQNFYGLMTAINISQIAFIAKNISVLSTVPELKLSISNWEYNAEKKVIDVPSWDFTLDLEHKMSEDSIELQNYDYSQPLTAVYDSELGKFTLPHGIPLICAEKKTEEDVSEVENYVNFFTPLHLGSQPANGNTCKHIKDGTKTLEEAVKKEEHQEKTVVPSNFGCTEKFETDAVVVYSTPKNVSLFVLNTNLPIRKFIMPRERFKQDAQMGYWFRVSLPDCKIIKKLAKPVLKTEVIDQNLIKLHTRMKVIEAFVNRNQVCGYSEELGAIIDNRSCLGKDELGKTIDVWVLSTSPTNGAHWRLFSKFRNHAVSPQRFSWQPSSLMGASKKHSSLDEQEQEDLKIGVQRAPKEADKSSHACFYDSLHSEENSIKTPPTVSPEKRTGDTQSNKGVLEVEAQVVEVDHVKQKVGICIAEENTPKFTHYVNQSMFSKTPSLGALLSVTLQPGNYGIRCKNIRVINKGEAEKGVEKSAAAKSKSSAEQLDYVSANQLITSDHNEGIEADAVVTFVSPSIVYFYAIRSKLTEPVIQVDIAEFDENGKPVMGDWYHLMMDSERDHRNISGVPRLKCLPTRVHKGKCLMVKTKVRIRRLPDMSSSSSCVCGYSEDVGPVLDTTNWLEAHQVHRTINVWVWHCKLRDGANWCIFNQNLER